MTSITDLAGRAAPPADPPGGQHAPVQDTSLQGASFPRAPVRRRRALLTIGAGFLLLALACVFAAFLAWRNIRSSDLVLEALEYRRAGMEVQNTLLQAEADQRGYLLTSDRAYLVPYGAAVANIAVQLQALRRHGAGVPPREALAAELTRVSEAKLALQQQTIELAEAGQAAAAMQLVRSGQGMRLMEEARALAGRLVGAAHGDVVRTTAAQRWLSTQVVLSIVVCLVCAAGLAMLLLRDMQRHLRQLAGREARLHELSTTLDQRVAQRTHALTQANLRFEVALRATGVTVATQDRDLVFTWISTGEFGISAEEIVGQTDEQVNPDPSMAAVVAIKRAVLEGGEPSRREVRVLHEGAEMWLDLSVQPLLDDAGATTGVITGAIDVTRYKEQETRIRLLMREVTHRSLNLLAVIEAIMRQTAGNATSLADFESRFSARLQSLAGSHDLLVQEDWSGASLRALVRSQLGHFDDVAASQVEISGPPLLIQPDAAQHIGMAMHELAANAAKYGALSVPGGKVQIGWQVEAGPEGASVCRLTWVEVGGPPVMPPTRRGFGRIVIERTVARAVQGEAKVDYLPTGVRWELTFPATYIVSH